MRWAKVRALPITLVVAPAVAQPQGSSWMRQLGSIESDTAWSIATDDAGGAYLAGFTGGGLAGPRVGAVDAFLARYDAAGDQAFVVQFGATGGTMAFSVSRDGTGGAYVGGLVVGDLGGPSAGQEDAFVARYGATGNRLWVRQFGTASGEIVEAVALVETGGAFAGGSTGGNLAGPQLGFGDAFLTRLGADGARLWTVQFGTGNSESVSAICPDGTGGAYVAGFTEGSLGGPNPSPGTSDAFVARYSGSGVRIWVRQLGTSGFDRCWAATSDGTGGVFVGGYTTGALGGPSAGETDAFIARYDAQGGMRLVRQLGTSNHDYVTALAVDRCGGAVLVGSTQGALAGPSSGSRDAYTIRYDADGNRGWGWQIGIGVARGVCADAEGRIRIGGTTVGSLGSPNQGGDDVFLVGIDTCRTDFDCDGFVTGSDFDEFVVLFEAGNPEADFDGDGFTTGLDFDEFVQAFEAGC